MELEIVWWGIKYITSAPFYTKIWHCEYAIYKQAGQITAHRFLFKPNYNSKHIKPYGHFTANNTQNINITSWSSPFLYSKTTKETVFGITMQGLKIVVLQQCLNYN